jgi:hypothetical protein
MDFRDGHWQAVQGNDMQVICDLGSEQELTYVSTNFYQYNNAWIFLPESVSIEFSSDGENWEPLASLAHQEPLEEEDKFIHSFTVGFQPAQARYVRMTAHSIGPNPEWHDSPGQPSWLFCDELILR